MGETRKESKAKKNQKNPNRHKKTTKTPRTREKKQETQEEMGTRKEGPPAFPKLAYKELGLCF